MCSSRQYQPDASLATSSRSPSSRVISSPFSMLSIELVSRTISLLNASIAST